MKTSIEWYQNAIFDILKEKENISDEIFLQNMLNIYLQAKEMEKEQMLDFGEFIIDELAPMAQNREWVEERYNYFKSE